MTLKQSLQQLKKEASQEHINEVVYQLLTTKIYAPAMWDKNPIKDENGQLGFEADTKIQLLIIQDEQKNCYFPMFTSLEELQEWKPKQQSLLLSFEQWISFTDMAQNQVEGIILNPCSEQIPLTKAFLQKLKTKQKSILSENTLQAGQKLHLMEPQTDIQQMIESIQKTCQNIPSIQSVYIKERFEEGKDSHWFILIKSQDAQTSYFEQIGRNLQGKTAGKKLEFMFANTSLAEQIIQRTNPIYEKK